MLWLCLLYWASWLMLPSLFSTTTTSLNVFVTPNNNWLDHTLANESVVGCNQPSAQTSVSISCDCILAFWLCVNYNILCILYWCQHYINILYSIRFGLAISKKANNYSPSKKTNHSLFIVLVMTWDSPNRSIGFRLLVEARSHSFFRLSRVSFITTDIYILVVVDRPRSVMFRSSRVHHNMCCSRIPAAPKTILLLWETDERPVTHDDDDDDDDGDIN